VPRLIEFRDALPLSAAGKMLRRLLRRGTEFSG
jgi:acyl-CoA synthetase (AMP-forming)/AMP-acid ligase II